MLLRKCATESCRNSEAYDCGLMNALNLKTGSATTNKENVYKLGEELCEVRYVVLAPESSLLDKNQDHWQNILFENEHASPLASTGSLCRLPKVLSSTRTESINWRRSTLENVFCLLID